MVESVRLVDSKDITPREICEGVLVKGLISRKRNGVEKLLLGTATLEPGCKEHFFSHDDTDELYYVIKGAVLLKWDGNALELSEGQAVFLPAGHKYSEINRTNMPALVVAALLPLEG